MRSSAPLFERFSRRTPCIERLFVSFVRTKRPPSRPGAGPARWVKFPISPIVGSGDDGEPSPPRRLVRRRSLLPKSDRLRLLHKRNGRPGLTIAQSISATIFGRDESGAGAHIRRGCAQRDAMTSDPGFVAPAQPRNAKPRNAKPCAEGGAARRGGESGNASPEHSASRSVIALGLWPRRLARAWRAAELPRRPCAPKRNAPVAAQLTLPSR